MTNYVKPVVKTGILLVNLGTPDAPTPGAVKRYLAEFLSDSRVIELPKFLWKPILHGFILRVRPKKVAKLYQKIWQKDSPIREIGYRQAIALEKLLQQKHDNQFCVALGMTYGNPSIKDALAKLDKSKIEKLIILPLFPQYSATTTAAVFDKTTKLLQQSRLIPELHFINHYYNNPAYIEAYTDHLQQHWGKHPKSDKLIFSFHGIPKAYQKKGDPYPQQCLETAKLIADKLGLSEEQWQVTFQSRFGPSEWVQPYTDLTLKSLAESGVKSIDITSPAFAADCLETLEELEIQNREVFLNAGGERYNYIPALNDNPKHIAALAELVEQC